MQYLRDLGFWGRAKKSPSETEDEEKGYSSTRDTTQRSESSVRTSGNVKSRSGRTAPPSSGPRSRMSEPLKVTIPARGTSEKPNSSFRMPVSKSPCVMPGAAKFASTSASTSSGTKRKHCLTPISSVGEELGDSMEDFGDLSIQDDLMFSQGSNTPIERQPVQRLMLPSGEYDQRHREGDSDNDDHEVFADEVRGRHGYENGVASPSDFIWMRGQQSSLSKEDYEGGGGRVRTSSISRGEDFSTRKLPTVFKWEGGGKAVYISGSFDNWKTKMPLVKSHGDFYTIIELPEGQHQYKFMVDGAWQCDPNEMQMDNDVGSKNNAVSVKASDFEVFEALAMDSNIGGVPTGSCKTTNEYKGISGSPPGEYAQVVPPRNSGQGFHHSGPPILPPHLLQVILNKEIPLHCEPTLLPEPNHVMLNHLYALSIKDGVMVLSATHRYRKKYVTTLLYKPI